MTLGGGDSWRWSEVWGLLAEGWLGKLGWGGKGPGGAFGGRAPTTGEEKAQEPGGGRQPGRAVTGAARQKHAKAPKVEWMDGAPGREAKSSPRKQHRNSKAHGSPGGGSQRASHSGRVTTCRRLFSSQVKRKLCLSASGSHRGDGSTHTGQGTVFLSFI